MTAHRRVQTAFGAALTGVAVLVVIGDPRAHAAVSASVMLVWGACVVLLLPRNGAFPPGSIVAAMSVRAPLLLVSPTLSDDVYRYVWEGKVLAAGLSPFAHAPDDLALATLRDANWALVNHREVSSIYPPATMLLFFLLSPAGVFGWRLAMAAADVATVGLLGRRSPSAAWTWALLPLPALETAVSGHLEGVGVWCLVLAIGGSNAAAWIGAMVKLLPGVLLLRSGLRSWLVWATLTALATLPFVGPGLARGFGTYATTWYYNGSVWPIFALMVGPNPARALCELIAIGIVLGITIRTGDRARIALWTTGAFVCLSPTVHPWYALWPLAAGLWTGTRAWTLLGVGMPLAYLVLASYDPATSAWVEPTWTKFMIYLPFYALLVRDATRAREADTEPHGPR